MLCFACSSNGSIMSYCRRSRIWNGLWVYVIRNIDDRFTILWPTIMHFSVDIRWWNNLLSLHWISCKHSLISARSHSKNGRISGEWEKLTPGPAISIFWYTEYSDRNSWIFSRSWSTMHTISISSTKSLGYKTKYVLMYWNNMACL